MMKTDIHKIKTEQAWNRLYDRLDKDHLLVEDHRMPKIPMWVRYGTVAAMVVGLVFSTLYWGFGQKGCFCFFATSKKASPCKLTSRLSETKCSGYRIEVSFAKNTTEPSSRVVTNVGTS